MQAEAFIFQTPEKIIPDASGAEKAGARVKSAKDRTNTQNDIPENGKNDFSITVDQVLKEQEDQATQNTDAMAPVEEMKPELVQAAGAFIDFPIVTASNDVDHENTVLPNPSMSKEKPGEQQNLLLKLMPEENMGQKEALSKNLTDKNQLLQEKPAQPQVDVGAIPAETKKIKVAVDSQALTAKVENREPATEQASLADPRKTDAMPVQSGPEKSSLENTLLNAKTNTNSDAGQGSQNQNRNTPPESKASLKSTLENNLESGLEKESAFEKSGKVLHSGQQSREVDHIQNFLDKSTVSEMQTQKAGAPELGQKIEMPVKIGNDAIMPKDLPPATRTEPVSSEAKPIQSNVMNQIVEKAVMRADKGRPEINIKLKPDFLGNVRMNIVTDRQQVMVRIITDVPAVKEIIESNISQLRAGLQNQGLEIDKFDVFVNQDSDHQGKRGSGGFFNRDDFNGAKRENAKQHEKGLAEKDIVQEDLEKDGIDYFV